MDYLDAMEQALDAGNVWLADLLVDQYNKRTPQRRSKRDSHLRAKILRLLAWVEAAKPAARTSRRGPRIAPMPKQPRSARRPSTVGKVA